MRARQAARQVHGGMGSPMASSSLIRALTRVTAGRHHDLLPARLAFRDAGHGFDALGLSPEWVAISAALLGGAYRHYFRVSSHGARLPADGAVILAANHAGTLPIDAALLYLDVLLHTDPPRIPRVIADVFVPRLPFVGMLMARVGVAAGTPGNFRHLIESGELVMVFPEGTPGIGKAFRDRYQLQGWRVGHAEVAIRHRVPVIPVGIVGAEEQWPLLGRLDLHPFGAPYLPVPATPFPLPVHYHIHYGEPLSLYEGTRPSDADDPEIVSCAAQRVKQAVQALLDRGLRERAGVFR